MNISTDVSSLNSLKDKITVAEEWLIGSKMTCLICGKKKRLKQTTNWVIDYENFYEDNAKTFCSICKVLSAYCLKCDEFTETSELEDWFYDYLFYTSTEHFNKKQANLCPKCRITTGEGPARCERCHKLGEYGKGKWNDNEGHIDCYHCNMLLCYECHELIHYNK